MKGLRFLVFVSVLVLSSFSISAFADDTSNLYRAELFTYGGLPVKATDGPDFKVLINTYYAAGYSEELKNPLWVVYRLGNMKKDFSLPKWERPDRFIVDTRTDAKVDHESYTGSDYDRGHMAPNEVMLEQYGQMAQYETYFMSNICPQTGGLNRGIWSKLEEEVREKVSQNDADGKEVHDVFVIAGPIFGDDPPARINDDVNGVAIPTKFYKILAYRKGYRGTIKSVAFVFSQDPDPDKDELLENVTTVDEIENLT